MRENALVVAVLAAALTLVGCDEPFDPPSELSSVRVLAARADPASGVPGQTARLSLLAVDADPAKDLNQASSELQIAWLGGCHNPPSRQFFACYPLLSGIASQLSEAVTDTDSSEFPKGYFGLGRDFELPLPADLLQKAPRAPADPIHFAVSYSFFGVCAGQLRSRPDYADRVPFECVDPRSGQALGHEHFVTGYHTLYTYEGTDNQHPSLTGVSIDGDRLTASLCNEDADCAAWAPADELGGCSGLGQCALVVPPCSGDCAKLSLLPAVDRSSAETLPEGGREVLWANYYATAGEFETATQLVNDRASGWVPDPSSLWQPPATENYHVRVWVTLHDQRGGAAFQSLDFIVRDAR